MNVVRLQDGTCAPGGQGLFGIKLGKDLSDNFALTYMGLAVRGPDGKLYQFAANNAGAPLQDVSGLELSFRKPIAYRIPVSTPTPVPGAILVTSDEPFSVLFVQRIISPTQIKGIDPFRQEQVDYIVPSNPFNLNFFVQVFSIFDVFGRGGLGSLPGVSPGGAPAAGTNALSPLALLLLTRGDDKSKGNDLISALLLSQAVGGGGGFGASPLATLILLSSLGDGSDDYSTLLLAQALGGLGAPAPVVPPTTLPPAAPVPPPAGGTPGGGPSGGGGTPGAGGGTATGGTPGGGGGASGGGGTPDTPPTTKSKGGS